MKKNQNFEHFRKNPLGPWEVPGVPWEAHGFFRTFKIICIFKTNKELHVFLEISWILLTVYKWGFSKPGFNDLGQVQGQDQDQGQGQDQKWWQRSALQLQMVLALTLALTLPQHAPLPVAHCPFISSS